MNFEIWKKIVAEKGLAGKKVCAYCSNASVEDFVRKPKMLCLHSSIKRARQVDLDHTCEYFNKPKAGGL